MRKLIEKPFVAGFTLMELLITIAIVGILAAIAVPNYVTYTRKAYYSEVVQAADAYKTAVSSCIQDNSGTMTACDGGSEGIPANLSAPSASQVNTITVTDGVILATPRAANGIVAADTLTLTPTYDSTSGMVTWAATGGGSACQYTKC